MTVDDALEWAKNPTAYGIAADAEALNVLAAQVKRLREEIKGYEQERELFKREIESRISGRKSILERTEAAEAERDRYREALKQIAAIPISGMSWQYDYERCVKIAKQALEGSNEKNRNN